MCTNKKVMAVMVCVLGFTVYEILKSFLQPQIGQEIPALERSQLQAENELVEYILTMSGSGQNLQNQIKNANITLKHISQDNPAIVRYVKEKLLLPPNTLPYKIKLINALSDPSEGQSRAVMELLKFKRNGFFVECGGNDGERLSNTLFLERIYNWSGILFEADPKNFERMKRTNRKVWMSPACLSVTTNPQQMSFYRNPFNLLVSGLNKRPYFGTNEEIKVSCLPLYTFLVALNKTDIDYLSLDVEGNELEILKTIPFHRVRIKVLTVEHAHFPGKLNALKMFWETKGYTYLKSIITPLTEDSVYVHSSVKRES